MSEILITGPAVAPILQPSPQALEASSAEISQPSAVHEQIMPDPSLGLRAAWTRMRQRRASDSVEDIRTPTASETQNDDTESTVSQNLNKDVKRRGFLKGMLRGAGLVAFHTVPETLLANVIIAYDEHQYIEQHWEKTPSSVSYINHEYDPTLHDEVFFFFPGLGDIHGHKEAQEILEHGELPKDTPMALITMSHQRTTKQEIVDEIKNALGNHPPKRVSMFGRSFGGPFGLSVLAEVCDDLNITLDRFVLCSSPDDIEHGNFGSWGAALDKFLPDWDWLDMDAKIIACYATQIQENGFFDVVGNYQRAEKAVENGESPVGLRSDTHLLRTNNIHQKSTLDRLARVTKPGQTKGKYVASHKPGSDHTVMDKASFNGFKQEFDKLGIQFDWLSAPFIGHAQIRPSTIALRPWFVKTNPPNKRILASK